jgi:RNA polymerase sigma-70 factor (ECF subfamily)
MSDRDSRWAERIRDGDDQAFEELFRAYYSELCGFAADYLNSVDRAHDIVHDSFLKIWKKRKNIKVNKSIKAYLYKTVRNMALNEIRNSSVRSEILDEISNVSGSIKKRTAIDEVELKKIRDEVDKAISELPERRRMAFLLHRRHGFTYKEVAKIMGVATKTVENQIGRALKSLRSELKNVFTNEIK